MIFRNQVSITEVIDNSIATSFFEYLKKIIKKIGRRAPCFEQHPSFEIESLISEMTSHYSKPITMLRGIDNIPQNILIHSSDKGYFMEYCQSHVILLWI